MTTGGGSMVGAMDGRTLIRGGGRQTEAAGRLQQGGGVVLLLDTLGVPARHQKETTRSAQESSWLWCKIGRVSLKLDRKSSLQDERYGSKESE